MYAPIDVEKCRGGGGGATVRRVLSLGMRFVASTCKEAMALFSQSAVEEQMEVGSAAESDCLHNCTVSTIGPPV